MANKEPVIVIKKVIVKKNGHHGGSWKVAFADFMTAMMAFFLVMWLIGQSEEVKEGVSDYFSTPSVIEYNYANYGAQLTLEKLFLDLVNEPLKAFEQFVRPMDKVPNIMDMGMQKIQLQYLESKLGEFGVTMNVISDEISFAVPADYLFQPGIPRPNDQFVPIMENIREIVMGLKDVDIFINSQQPMKSEQFSEEFNMLAEARLDLISQKIEASIERENVDIYGKTTVEPLEGNKNLQAMIQFRIKQKFSDVTKVKEKTVVPEAAPVENVYYDENSQQQYKESYEKTMKDQIAPEAMPKIEDPSDGFGSFVDDVSSSGFPETE